MVQEDDSILCFYCATAIQNRIPVTGQPILLNWVQQKAIAKFNKHAYMDSGSLRHAPPCSSYGSNMIS